MRLIDIPSMTICEYQGEEVPPYAILSHTWGKEEVSFSDFEEGRRASMQGFQKILGCCRQAAYDGLKAVWIDTCCIDKRSSAELSEAINSMFKWYQNAAICYAYLDDVDSDDGRGSVLSPTGNHYPTGFPRSRWFTRGWTLQELLAPSAVIFYAVDWVSIGSRHDLADIIAKITHIDIRFFASGNFDDFSIAQRMSWASHRQTTRVEDQAYCLLGLFGVNMPLLYGEGEQAFVRLQQEIMKESDDQTIFAWDSNELSRFSVPQPPQENEKETDGQTQPVWKPNPLSDFWGRDLKGGILASSPKLFAGSGHIVRSETTEVYGPYSATNKGLQISLPLLSADTATSILIPSQSVDGVVVPSLTLTVSRGNIAVLNCQPYGDNESRIGLFIEQQRETGSYIRVNHQEGLASIPLQQAREKSTQTDFLIQLQNKIARTSATPTDQANRVVLIQPFNKSASEFKLSRSVSDNPWQRLKKGSAASVISDFSSAKQIKHPCLLEYTNANGHGFVLVLQKHIALGKVTGLAASIIENARIADGELAIGIQVREAMYNLRKYGPARPNQLSSSGLLEIVPKITEARHASLVTIDTRKVTPSIKKIKFLDV
ncbi:heterokaryon incompatibility protein-domain-containing protein [Xylaria palmicola]|nr:heterokaryon incompatibility protein-domain-containing protein [Xylaria palmicola]